MIAEHQEQFKNTCRPYEGLWHGTGTGKTRTALYALKEYSGSILIIAPKTTCEKKQWEYEANILGIEPPIVISKEQFRRDHKILPRYRAIVGEEAHTLFGVMPNTRQKNYKKIPKASQLFEAVEWYIENHKPERVIMCTATPNKTPMAIWAAAKLLGHNLNFYEFRDQFYIRLPMDNEIYSPKRDDGSMKALADITKSIGHVLRLADIKDVPDQKYIIEEFEPNKQQLDAIKELPERFNGSSLRGKQHQIENGILYNEIYNPEINRIEKETQRFSNAKLDYIVERSCEFPKMIIFANYTEQIDAISDALKAEGKSVWIMDSRTKNRKQLEEEVEKAESAYVIAQSMVSSEWEFKSCPVVIFASLSNRNIDYIQGQGRVQRYDQIKVNLYIHLITKGKGSIDKRWYDTIMSGRDFNEALFEV